MVRPAKIEDKPAVLELLKDFHKESMDKYNILCDDKIANDFMDKCVDTSFVLEIENKIVGILGGMITNYPLNNEKMYYEWVWYVDPKYRLHGVSLFHYLEDYCKDKGIKKIGMALMANSKAEKLEKFYKRLGFELLEKHFIKHIGG
jgi:GNAT superfamily N-acetyltransferase